MSSVSSSWALKHGKHRSSAKISSQFGNVGPQYSVHFFPKNPSWKNSFDNAFEAVREKKAAINEYCLLLKHFDGFCAQNAVVTGTSSPSLFPNLTCVPSPHSLGSDLSRLQWVMTNIFSLMEETKVSLLS